MHKSIVFACLVWIATACPAGPTGPTGPRGITGASGGQGLLGPRGFNGSIGHTGLTGPAGPTGAQGSIVFTTDGVQSIGAFNKRANNLFTVGVYANGTGNFGALVAPLASLAAITATSIASATITTSGQGTFNTLAISGATFNAGSAHIVTSGNLDASVGSLSSLTVSSQTSMSFLNVGGSSAPANSNLASIGGLTSPLLVSSLGAITVQATANAVSTVTGSITTAGGISTAKDIWVGGVLTVAGATLAAGSANIATTGTLAAHATTLTTLVATNAAVATLSATGWLSRASVMMQNTPSFEYPGPSAATFFAAADIVAGTLLFNGTTASFPTDTAAHIITALTSSSLFACGANGCNWKLHVINNGLGTLTMTAGAGVTYSTFGTFATKTSRLLHVFLPTAAGSGVTIIG